MEKRKISQEELEDILKKHKKWLNNQNGGERANLIDADLSYLNFKKVDLRCAKMTSVNLTHADLTDTVLKNADLRSANLTDTVLKNADLTDTNLAFANLKRANLKGTDLTNTTIWDTIFSNAGGKSIISIQLNTSVENRVINYIPEIDWVSAGCFRGTLEELKNKVKYTHSDNEKIRKRYEKAIEFIEFLKKEYEND